MAPDPRGWPHVSPGEGFGTRLRAALDKYGSLCVGIDPHGDVLRGVPGGDSVTGLEYFSQSLLDACVDTVGIVKPQVAFFERFGSAGLAILERLTWQAHDAGLLVIADAKRGDISSTLQGYADAWLRDASPFFCDAMTLSPYLGVNALRPAFTTAFTYGKGLFVLAVTSNSEAEDLQRATTPPGFPLSSDIANQVAEWNHRGQVLEEKIATSVTGLTSDDLRSWRSAGYLGEYMPDEYLSFVDAVKARWVRARVAAGTPLEDIRSDFDPAAARYVTERSHQMAETTARYSGGPIAVLERFKDDDDAVLEFEQYWNWRQAIFASASEGSMGPFGLVVGATVARHRINETLSEVVVGHESLPILAPGFGAQGARLSDIEETFGSRRHRDVVASVSRGVLRRGLAQARASIREMTVQLSDASA